MTEALLALALAFAAPDNFKLPPEVGGANGMRFSGSPSSRWDCSVCHEPAPQMAVGLSAAPALFADGYEPGRTYVLDIALDEPAEASAFSLEIAGRSGAVAGQLAQAPALPPEYLCDEGSDPVEIQGSGEAAQSVSCRKGLQRWRVLWTAPASDIGPLTAYLAVVKGNGDGTPEGDQTAARVMGIPSQSAPTPSCGILGAAVLPLFAAVFARRRPARWLIAAAAIVSLTADASEPEATSTRGAKAPVEVDVLAGLGVRDLSLISTSFSTSLRVHAAYPTATIALTAFPTQLAGLSDWPGLLFEASYLRGWVVGDLGLGNAAMLPSDGRLALGYRWQAGGFELEPRVVYRVALGGADANVLFDDPVYQGLGLELRLGARVGALALKILPQVLRVLDDGTLVARGYGPFEGGWLLGGSADASWDLADSGFALFLRYGFSLALVRHQGHGERALERVAFQDLGHVAQVGVSYCR